MRRYAQRMIAAALKQGGTYYLPYRLHATQAQFEAGYPNARQFVRRKLSYDPGDCFRAGFI